MTDTVEAIRAEQITKVFGTVTALAGVSLSVMRGETLGILGDNGAGKSTLIKILTGYHQPDDGQVFVDGRPVRLGSVDEAKLESDSPFRGFLTGERDRVDEIHVPDDHTQGFESERCEHHVPFLIPP